MLVISEPEAEALPPPVNWKVDGVLRIRVPDPEISFGVLSAIIMSPNVPEFVGNVVHAVTVREGEMIVTWAEALLILRHTV